MLAGGTWASASIRRRRRASSSSSRPAVAGSWNALWWRDRWRWSSVSSLMARRKAPGWGRDRIVSEASRSGWRSATAHATWPPQSWPTRWKRAGAAATRGGGDVDHVGHQPVDPVRLEVARIGPHARRVAPAVGRHRPVAGGAERRDLVPPRVARLREPVEQHHQLTVGRSGDVGGEPAGRRLDLGGHRRRYAGRQPANVFPSAASCSSSGAGVHCGPASASSWRSRATTLARPIWSA